MHRKYYILFLLLLVCAFTACTPRSIREAQEVVAQADSLWHEGRMYGVDEGDSATLAQAYEALEAIPLPFREGLGLGSPYAHACYHYGKLLRAKENPVEAMQAFIAATHSRTKDYHILGRVYSNMGSICHLAGEFPLSYEMYAHSADMFLRAEDSIAYFYALNDMAFEMADMADSASCLSLVRKLKAISSMYELTSITKAELYTQCQNYDSAIYYADLLINNAVYAPTCALIKAQAYDNLGRQDSALIYANRVLNTPDATYQNKFNALYVVLHNDSNLTAEDINSLASYREDIRYYEYEPEKEKLVQAVQLCEQDIARKPDWRWLYAIIVTLFVVGVSIFIYVCHKHKKHELLAQKLNILQQATTTIQERHDALEASYMNTHQHIVEDINNKCSVLRNNDKIHTTLAWKNYHRMCSAVDKQFYLLAFKLRSKQCLNETEIRLCVLTLLDCGYDQMAELLFRSTTSIGTLKIRVAGKLGTSSKNLRQYLIDNECLK